jgi:hypothetical protein
VTTTRPRSRGLALALAAAAIALAGCGQPPGRTPAAVPADVADDHVLLRVEEYAGMTGWRDATTPRRFVLTADGTLLSVVPGAGMLPTIRETHLPPDALAAAWAMVQASGVARDGKLDIPGLFDAQSSFFTVDDGTRSTTLQVYGLGATGDVAGPEIPAPSGEAPARLAATDLLAELTALADGVAVEAPRLAVYVADAGDAEGAEVPWTGPLELATAGAPVTTPGFERCAILEGDHAAAAAELARTLPVEAIVVQDGARWVVGVRPLFADEPDPEGCGPA